KLEGSTQIGDEAPMPRKTRAIWIGSRVVLTPSGAYGRSKKDINAEALPGVLKTLEVEPKRLPFPALTKSGPGIHSTSGNGTLYTSGLNSGFAGPGITTLKGRVTRGIRAEPLSATLARIGDERSFVTDESEKTRIDLSYRSVGRFDRTRGLPNEIKTTF